ncbi:hypothetical protein TIFTF001_001924 [Ficus carica]|uniref:Uncharacterized protein n=1 Tax=Ficus carica TaxID=3494 RepID=A0AA88CSN7_FICCA|nr:hypothetical protein TIFTF001_001924 [Ficus carica]
MKVLTQKPKLVHLGVWEINPNPITAGPISAFQEQKRLRRLNLGLEQSRTTKFEKEVEENCDNRSTDVTFEDFVVQAPKWDDENLDEVINLEPLVAVDTSIKVGLRPNTEATGVKIEAIEAMIACSGTATLPEGTLMTIPNGFAAPTTVAGFGSQSPMLHSFMVLIWERGYAAVLLLQELLLETCATMERRKSLNATEVSTGVETTETKVNIFENLRFEESRFKDNKARHDKLHMEFKTIWKYSLLPLWTFDVSCWTFAFKNLSRCRTSRILMLQNSQVATGSHFAY